MVAQGRACPRDASNRLPVGLHLLRRAPGHRRRRHPGDAERQRQGHGPVSRTLRRYPGPGCARRHDVRRRRLARRARPHRPRQRHLGAVAALQSRTQPRRAGLALPTRTLPIAPRPRRHRGHHRRLLPSMDRPHRRTGSYANPLRLSMDHEGDFIGSLVSDHWKEIAVPAYAKNILRTVIIASIHLLLAVAIYSVFVVIIASLWANSDIGITTFTNLMLNVGAVAGGVVYTLIRQRVTR